jgi:putative transposase
MARQARLVLPGHAHYIVQRGHSRQAVFADADDRRAYIAALSDAARATQVQIHALALLDTEVRLLATPPDANALGRMMQAVGRRYVSAYNRRHIRSGTLWDGRFRCALVEPGGMRLNALCLIDGQLGEPGVTSAAHRLGLRADPLITDPPEFWQLGNTPFEREAAYAAMLSRGLPSTVEQSFHRAVTGGWPVGSTQFKAEVATQTARAVQPAARGRPRSRSPL